MSHQDQVSLQQPLLEILSELVQKAMESSNIPARFSALVSVSRREGFGDFQANGAMGAAKQLKKNPREIAEQIKTALHADSQANEILDAIDVAGPGFINLTVKKTFLSDALSDLVCLRQQEAKTVVVDYSSPNLAKEMHVGHLRSTIIGDAMVRVLERLGHKVIRQNHVGDWGTQFGMLIAELKEQLEDGEAAQLALKDLETFYQQAKKHFDEDENFAKTSRDYVVKLQAGDPEVLKLWEEFRRVSLNHAQEVYDILDVTLNESHVFGESEYNKDLASIVDLLLTRGIARRDQGAVVVFIDSLKDKNGEPSVCIVQKQDGGYLYSTTDLAGIQYRSKTLNADRVLIFTDARQSLHMKQVFAVAEMAGLKADKTSLEHMPFGTMMGKDGKPFKTRTGGTVKFMDLLQEAKERAAVLVRDKNPDLPQHEIDTIAHQVGIGSVKYADLSKTRTNDYIFDWDSMLSFEGNTAPYMQYAVARISSLFDKAEGKGLNDIEQTPLHIEDPTEKALALTLCQYPLVVEQMAADGFPHSLCHYLYDLAGKFSSFYEHCPILKENVEPQTAKSRLRIALFTHQTLQEGLKLLGISTMDKM